MMRPFSPKVDVFWNGFARMPETPPGATDRAASQHSLPVPTLVDMNIDPLEPSSMPGRSRKLYMHHNSKGHWALDSKRKHGSGQSSLGIDF